jgi:hypothetical protein
MRALDDISRDIHLKRQQQQQQQQQQQPGL